MTDKGTSSRSPVPLRCRLLAVASIVVVALALCWWQRGVVGLIRLQPATARHEGPPHTPTELPPPRGTANDGLVPSRLPLDDNAQYLRDYDAVMLSVFADPSAQRAGIKERDLVAYVGQILRKGGVPQATPRERGRQLILRVEVCLQKQGADYVYFIRLSTLDDVVSLSAPSATPPPIMTAMTGESIRFGATSDPKQAKYQLGLLADDFAERFASAKTPK